MVITVPRLGTVSFLDKSGSEKKIGRVWTSEGPWRRRGLFRQKHKMPSSLLSSERQGKQKHVTSNRTLTTSVWTIRTERGLISYRTFEIHHVVSHFYPTTFFIQKKKKKKNYTFTEFNFECQLPRQTYRHRTTRIVSPHCSLLQDKICHV